jgi:uncharacterized protein
MAHANRVDPARPRKNNVTSIKPMIVCATAMFFALTAAAQAQGRPSWCNSQSSFNLAERTICATQKLWNLDYQLNIIYQGALETVGSERPRLQKSQQDWVRVTRNGCNSDDTCLEDVYDRRISVLRRIDNRGHMLPNE